MSVKPSLSPSKIATYLACPVKYYQTYVDPRGRWYLRSKSYYSFGTSLHRVLQRFHDAGDRGVDTVHQALAALEESWIESGYGSAEEMEQALGEGKAILVDYLKRLESARPKATVLMVERRLRMEFPSWVLVGQVDRVDEHEDGMLEIIDYKSGRQSVTEEDVKNDLAIGCYTLLLQRQFPDRAVCATIIALRSGSHATASFTRDEVESFRLDLDHIGHEIVCREFSEVEPIRKPLCSGCDFLPLCLKHYRFGS